MDPFRRCLIEAEMIESRITWKVPAMVLGACFLAWSLNKCLDSWNQDLPCREGAMLLTTEHPGPANCSSSLENIQIHYRRDGDLLVVCHCPK